MRVLVVEDEPKMAALVARGLREEGHAADIAATGENALWMVDAAPYDAVLLDVMLPGLDGFATLRRLREREVWVPVLMLTARDAIGDRVSGLDTGADDYLTKPFSFDELLARLRAIVRRAPGERPTTIEVGDLRLDPAAHRVWRGETEVELSTREFAVLELFMRRPGAVLSRLQLLDGAWDMAFESRSNVVDVYVRYLREKIDRPFGRESLETVRGIGYRLRSDGGAASSRLPIRLRLTLPFAAAMGLGLAAMGLFIYLRVGDTLLSTVDQTLAAQLTEARQHVLAGSRRLVDEDVSDGPTIAQLVRGDGTVVESTPRPLPPLAGGAARAVGRTSRSIPGLRGTWRLELAPVRVGGAPATLVVGRSLAARAETLDHLGHEFLVAAPAALILALVAGYGLAAAALRPVEAMRRRAAAVTATTPGRRLPVPRAHDEISALANTLNDMLARLEASFEHERRFVADASHELRTPLALLKAELELALRRPRSREELETALASAAEETERLTRLAEDLLLIARADQGRLPIRPERLHTDEVLDRVRARFAGRAESLGRTLRLDEDEDPELVADPVRLEQAIGNLVDNALQHGAGTVTLGARAREGQVDLYVTDEGPGLPPGFIDRAFDRFSRPDDGRTSGGIGLGLSIVELIARAHGGEAHVENRIFGGTEIWIALPAATPSADSAAPSVRLG